MQPDRPDQWDGRGDTEEIYLQVPQAPPPQRRERPRRLLVGMVIIGFMVLVWAAAMLVAVKVGLFRVEYRD